MFVQGPIRDMLQINRVAANKNRVAANKNRVAANKKRKIKTDRGLVSNQLSNLAWHPFENSLARCFVRLAGKKSFQRRRSIALVVEKK